MIQIGAFLREDAVADVFDAGVVHRKGGGGGDIKIDPIHVHIGDRVICQDESSGACQRVAFGPDPPGGSSVDGAAGDHAGSSASGKSDHVGVSDPGGFVPKVSQGHVLDDDPRTVGEGETGTTGGVPAQNHAARQTDMRVGGGGKGGDASIQVDRAVQHHRGEGAKVDRGIPRDLRGGQVQDQEVGGIVGAGRVILRLNGRQGGGGSGDVGACFSIHDGVGVLVKGGGRVKIFLVRGHGIGGVRGEDALDASSRGRKAIAEAGAEAVAVENVGGSPEPLFFVIE